MHLGEEHEEQNRANGSGSGRGRARTASERPDVGRDRAVALSDASVVVAEPLVNDDAQVDDPAPTSAPLRLPSHPDESATVERNRRARDLVSLGECLVEMSRRPDGAYQPSIAGDAFNTLFYASRLGLRTGLVTAVGDDLFTPMIVERLSDESVDVSNVYRLRKRRNGIYFIEHNAWGERSFHYWRDGSAATETLMHVDLARLEAYARNAHFLLITGVTLAVFKECQRLRALLESIHGHTTIVFDANYRRQLWQTPHDYQFQVELIMPFVDVYLPSRQDLESAYADQMLLDVLRGYADVGVSTVVMKDGSDGCAMLVDNELVKLAPIERSHVVDTTGAGDAFNAGLIAGLLRGSSLEGACDLSQRVAARTLIVPGAIDPAFTPHAIDVLWG